MGTIATQQIYLALGSNLGDRLENIRNAVSLISLRIGDVISKSSIYETAPWGYESSSSYYNCCIEVISALNPYQLLDVSQQIEREMGRKIKNHYSDRIIDIDILFVGELKIKDSHLIIPHPHMYDRLFVLKPLSDIAPNIKIPPKQITVADRLKDFSSAFTQKLSFYY